MINKGVTCCGVSPICEKAQKAAKAKPIQVTQQVSLWLRAKAISSNNMTLIEATSNKGMSDANSTQFILTSFA
jgi:hypothetical protein